MYVHFLYCQQIICKSHKILVSNNTEWKPSTVSALWHLTTIEQTFDELMEAAVISTEYAMSLHCNVCVMEMVEKQSADDVPDLTLEVAPRVSPKLCKCNGCNLVHYCGAEHQQCDWRNHRRFCKAAQQIKDLCGVRHPYLLNGQPKTREDFDRTTLQVKFLLCKALGRPLRYNEEEVTSFPAHCAVCFSLRRLRPCNRCMAVSYCGEEHAAQDAEQHKHVCLKLQLHYCPFKLQYPTTSYIKELHRQVPDMNKCHLATAIEHAAMMRLPVNPTASLANYTFFSAVANFSCIATILYTLTYVDMDEYPNTKFVIFMVGATVEQVLWFQEIHTKFFFLQHPKITELELHFIGPEMVVVKDRQHSIQFLGRKRTILYKSYRMLLQIFMKDHNIKPSLIAAFNCGFSEHVHLQEEQNDLGATDMWLGGLIELVQTFAVPIVFTSFTCLEAEFDYAALLRIAQVEKLETIKITRLFNIMQNPYRDLRPLRRWQMDDSEQIYYRNGYVQAVHTRLIC